MDIMMVKKCLNIENCSENLERVKKMRLQRLYITLDKLSKLDTGEYVLLHNPKKPFQVEVYQLSTFVNILVNYVFIYNMYKTVFILDMAVSIY
jgi:hypothetical protein